jgi:hypothetical protein
MTRDRIAFRRIADAALLRAALIVPRWLPDGRREGHEWVARNPTRNDHKLGSFKINLKTGRWADFAAGADGGDLISLAGYLYRLSNCEAALKIAEMVGVSPYE